MGFIPTNNAVIATMVYAVAGREVTNGFAWLGAAPFDTAACADLAGAMRDAWQELLIGKFTSGYTLTKIRVVAQDGVDAPFFELPITADNVGTASGTALASNVCMNIGLYTGLRGRSFRGLLKHPSTISGQLLNLRRFNVSDIANISTAYADYIDAVQSAASGAPEHAVISYSTDGSPRLLGLATPITFYQGYQRVGSISRRTT